MYLVQVGLHIRNPSWTRSSLFPVGNPLGPASTSPEHFMVELEDFFVSPALPSESSLVWVLSK
jgi:hypothetical protein